MAEISFSGVFCLSVFGVALGGDGFVRMIGPCSILIAGLVFCGRSWVYLVLENRNASANSFSFTEE